MRGRVVAGILLFAAVLSTWLVVRERGAGRIPGDPVRRSAPELTIPAAPEAARTEAEGGGTIVGRVIDQHGAPWVDLAIAVDGRSVRTGPDGRFELAGLPLGVLALDLSAEFDGAVPLGERRLACALPPLRVDLVAQGGLADVGSQIVPRSRPFWIEGTVLLDEDWARSKGVTVADVRLTFEVPSPEELGSLLEPEITPRPGAPTDWNRPPWRTDLPEAPPLSPDGYFRVGLETPHDPLLMRLSLRRFEPIERLIVPTPGGRFAETFRMP
jgi:hypothetical protein